MKGKDIRHKIFSIYSKNLQYVAEEYNIEIEAEERKINFTETLVYICPLCFKAFSAELLDCSSYSNPLTVEDLPPKSVGGSPKILTCKHCNSTSGHTLDHSIIKSLKAESFLKKIPTSKIDSLVGINKGKKFRTVTEIGNEGQIQFKFDVKKNVVLKRQIDKLATSWQGSTIEFSFSFPAESLYKRALLRIGMLLSFYYFGNRVLFEGNYHKIREIVLKNEKMNLLEGYIISFPESIAVESGIHLLMSPEKYKIYLIVFKIKAKGLIKTIGVPFPGPGKIGWNNFQNFKEIGSEGKVVFKNITSTLDICDKKRIIAYDNFFNIKLIPKPASPF